MKLKKSIVLAALAVIVPSGAVFAYPMGSLPQLPQLPFTYPMGSLPQLPQLPFTLPDMNFPNLSALLNNQLGKILGKDAAQVLDSKGNLDPYKAWDAGAGDKAVSEAIAKEYGLSSDNANRIIAAVQSSENIDAQAQNADNSLDTSKQISAGIRNLMRQTADNALTTKTLVSVAASNQKLLTEARDKAKEEQTQSYLLNQASKPFFLFSK